MYLVMNCWMTMGSAHTGEERRNGGNMRRKQSDISTGMHQSIVCSKLLHEISRQLTHQSSCKATSNLNYCCFYASSTNTCNSSAYTGCNHEDGKTLISSDPQIGKATENEKTAGWNCWRISVWLMVIERLSNGIGTEGAPQIWPSHLD